VEIMISSWFSSRKLDDTQYYALGAGGNKTIKRMPVQYATGVDGAVYRVQPGNSGATLYPDRFLEDAGDIVDCVYAAVRWVGGEWGLSCSLAGYSAGVFTNGWVWTVFRDKSNAFDTEVLQLFQDPVPPYEEVERVFATLVAREMGL
jgi:hypothetical protein